MFSKYGIALFACLSLSACLQDTGSQGSKEGASPSGSSAASPVVAAKAKPTLQVNLSDIANSQLQGVFVDIDRVEVFINKGSKTVRYIMGSELGLINLQQLGQNLILPLGSFDIPVGSKIQQVRLHLKEAGHYAVKADGSVCELKTPSAQQTGVKIIQIHKHQFDSSKDYALNLSFNSDKSVVVKPHGDCLLKPVIKLESLTAVDRDSSTDDEEVIIDDGGSSDDPGNVVDDSDTGVDNSGDGSVDTGDGTTDGGTSDSGNQSGGSDTGSTDGSNGAADGTTTDGSNTSSGDGTSSGGGTVDNPDDWDYTPIIDGVPTIIVS